MARLHEDVSARQITADDILKAGIEYEKAELAGNHLPKPLEFLMPPPTVLLLSRYRRRVGIFLSYDTRRFGGAGVRITISDSRTSVASWKIEQIVANDSARNKRDIYFIEQRFANNLGFATNLWAIPEEVPTASLDVIKIEGVNIERRRDVYPFQGTFTKKFTPHVVDRKML